MKNLVKALVPEVIKANLKARQKKKALKEKFLNALRPTDVFLVGHPKSGNTWLAYMLGIVSQGENHQAFSPQDIRFTQKDGVLYVFVLAPPTENIKIKKLANGGLLERLSDWQLVLNIIQGEWASCPLENTILVDPDSRLSQLGVLIFGKIAKFSKRLADAVGLRPPEIQRNAGDFSGGNQQKIVLAKWLGREPSVIVLDEPTRGVDVGAKAEIHRLVNELADNGAAVLVVSSDLPELLDISDVIHVVRDGKVVGTLPSEVADEKSVMTLASGGTGMIGV